MGPTTLERQKVSIVEAISGGTIRTMASRSEIALTVALVAAALATAGASVYREVAGARRSSAGEARVAYMPGWEELLEAGRVMGDSAAPVKVFEFVDLQCPFCNIFDSSVRSATSDYGGSVAAVFIHLPSPGHPHALAGARAIECANAQDRFGELVRVIFDDQDSLARIAIGDVPDWWRYAERAGVSDSLKFMTCAAGSDTAAMIKLGIAAAVRHQVNATPTVIINGLRFSSPPGDSVLRLTIDELLGGQRPEALMRRLNKNE